MSSDLKARILQFIEVTNLTADLAISNKLAKDNQLKNQYQRGRMAVCRELKQLLETIE